MLRHLLTGSAMSRESGWLIQFLRYTVVGGLSFVVDYGLLYVLTEWCGLYYILSATLSFAAGLTVNYLLSIKWVFRRSVMNNRMAEFAVFGIIGVAGLLLNNGLLYVFTEWCGLHYLLSKLFSAAIVLCWNFAGRKIVLFR